MFYRIDTVDFGEKGPTISEGAYHIEADTWIVREQSGFVEFHKGHDIVFGIGVAFVRAITGKPTEWEAAPSPEDIELENGPFGSVDI